MLLLVFIVVAGNAVRCDDDSSGYYLIEMAEGLTAKVQPKAFNVYWNVPTMQCKSKRIPFTDLYGKYGIIQNSNDSFRGERIAILYDPGLFPALLKNETSGQLKFRNGGVPQEGNIKLHLEAFRLAMEQSIPDANFNGVGIIDFESWRPILRQDFGVLAPYKEVSYEIERKLHWWWPKTWIQDEAKQRYEEAAKVFMQSTVSIAKQMRPKALWGYYGYPYCFNMAANNPSEKCPANVIKENNQINWLWTESSALYPSVYSSKSLTTKQLTQLIRGRVTEAGRVRKSGPILPYFWYRYRDGGFLSETDLHAALKTFYKSNASGFIIWGSSNDVNTVAKCKKLKSYLENTLGPAVSKYVKSTPRFDETTDFYTTTESITTEVTNTEANNKLELITLTTNEPSFEITDDTIETSQYLFNTETQTVLTIAEGIKQTTPGLEVTDEKLDLSENPVINVLLSAVSSSKVPLSSDSVSTEKFTSSQLYTTASNTFIDSSSSSILNENKISTSSPVFGTPAGGKSSLLDIVVHTNQQNFNVTTETSQSSTEFSTNIELVTVSTESYPPISSENPFTYYKISQETNLSTDYSSTTDNKISKSETTGTTTEGLRSAIKTSESSTIMQNIDKTTEKFETASELSSTLSDKSDTVIESDKTEGSKSSNQIQNTDTSTEGWEDFDTSSESWLTSNIEIKTENNKTEPKTIEITTDITKSDLDDARILSIEYYDTTSGAYKETDNLKTDENLSSTIETKSTTDKNIINTNQITSNFQSTSETSTSFINEKNTSNTAINDEDVLIVTDQVNTAEYTSISDNSSPATEILTDEFSTEISTSESKEMQQDTPSQNERETTKDRVTSFNFLSTGSPDMEVVYIL